MLAAAALRREVEAGWAEVRRLAEAREYANWADVRKLIDEQREKPAVRSPYDSDA